MEAWRQRLATLQRQMLEEDDDDEAAMEIFQSLIDVEVVEEVRVPHRGSRPGKVRNLDRERQQGHERMWMDYFCATPVYGPDVFRRRYRMQRPLFLRIMEKVCARDGYFVQRVDACGSLGLSSIQKCTAALRMLAYGVTADATDEYCRLGESTAMESMKKFCVAVREEFGDFYLRRPSREDYEAQMLVNEARGFPGMFASLDCMHYEWKSCPVAWQGHFGDRDGNKSIILEAIADQSLHIWHIFFGLPGSNNDLNVLDRSPLVKEMLTGGGRDLRYVINGVEYNRYYLLADGIYPPWACFVQTIHAPTDEKRKHYVKRQEACRKDVERCFGVLQARFAIVQNPCRQWSLECIKDIMVACCILHNMIIDDEHGAGLDLPCELGRGVPLERGIAFDDLAAATIELEDEDTHYSLRGDLIEHLWALKGRTET